MKKFEVIQQYYTWDSQIVEAETSDQAIELCKTGENWEAGDIEDYQIYAREIKDE